MPNDDARKINGLFNVTVGMLSEKPKKFHSFADVGREFMEELPRLPDDVKLVSGWIIKALHDKEGTLKPSDLEKLRKTLTPERCVELVNEEYKSVVDTEFCEKLFWDTEFSDSSISVDPRSRAQGTYNFADAWAGILYQAFVRPFLEEGETLTYQKESEEE